MAVSSKFKKSLRMRMQTTCAREGHVGGDGRGDWLRHPCRVSGGQRGSNCLLIVLSVELLPEHQSLKDMEGRKKGGSGLVS